MWQGAENIERLSQDLLDDNFVSNFFIPQLILTAVGFQRVRIRFKFASAPSNLYRLYSCFFWLANVAAVVDYSIYNSTAINSMDHFIKLGLILNTVINVGTAGQNIFLNSHLNNQLYVKMQKLYRIRSAGSKVTNNGVSNRGAFVVILCCVSWFGYMYVFNTRISSSFRLSGCVAACSGLPLNIEIVLCSIILSNVKKTVDYINNLLQREMAQLKETSKDPLIKTRIWMTHCSTNVKPAKQSPANVSQSILSVLELLADFVKLFQFPVSKLLSIDNKIGIICTSAR